MENKNKNSVNQINKEIGCYPSYQLFVDWIKEYTRITTPCRQYTQRIKSDEDKKREAVIAVALKKITGEEKAKERGVTRSNLPMEEKTIGKGLFNNRRRKGKGFRINP